MTTEPSFASLSPTLLARKGGAKPAMRPQHARLQPTAMPSAATGEQLEDLGWDDMGDHTQESAPADVVKLTPAAASPEAEAETALLNAKVQADLNHVGNQPAVHRQQAELSDRLEQSVKKSEPVSDAAQRPAEKHQMAALASPAPSAEAAQRASQRKRRSALDRGKRAAFTLRLDAERHLKLRLACTIHSSSAQQLVTKALDELLADMPEIGTLAAQVSRD